MSDTNEKREELDRRTFLVAAGGVAAASLGASGCTAALARAAADRVDSEVVADFLGRFDHALDEIDAQPVMRRLIEEVHGADALAGASREVEERVADGDRLGRRVLRFLTVAGMIHDLPREERSARSVTERLERIGPELDETATEITRLVGTCPAWVRRRAHDALRDPDVVMQLGEALDARARDIGMGPAGRSRLRATCTHVTGRLRRQPPDLLIDETLDKVERLAAGQGIAVEDWRALTTDAPRHVFWSDPDRGDRRAAKSPEDATGEATGAGAPLEGGQPLDVTELIARLSDPSAARRVAAATALGERRIAEAVPALTRSLEVDPSPEVRGWALRALYQIHTREARDAVLRAARGDPDERVRQLALQLLGLEGGNGEPGESRDAVRGEAGSRGPGSPDEREEAERRLRRSGAAVFGTGAGGGGIGGVLTAAGAASGSIEGLFVVTTGGIIAGIAVVLMLVGSIVLAVRVRRLERGDTGSGRGGRRSRRDRREREGERERERER
jgi:hypothetical protein